MNTKHRVVGIVVLLAVIGGLCVGYGAADQWSYPQSDDLAANPGLYDGEKTLLFGTVESVDRDNGAIVITSGDNPEIRLTVEEVPPAVIDEIGVGGGIQVYGSLREQSSVVVADQIVTDYRDTTDKLYVYGTSMLGAVLAAGYFLRFWRIDFRQGRIVPRGETDG